MSEREKPLPCPFCGWDEPTPQFDPAAPDEDPSLNNGYVHCLECGAFGPTGETLEGGIKAWNVRAKVQP